MASEIEKQVEHLNLKATDLLTQEVINEWEYDFIRSMKGRNSFSEKQEHKINDIWDKFEEA